MRINNNLQAINTHRQMGISALDGSKSMEKLSSGFRINRAGDDAAGLAISEKMRGQIRGLNMASKNSSDTISLIQTAEGALAETHSILQRMRELAVQSANDTNTDFDRMELQAEVTQLKAEIDRIGNTTEFNTKKLLEGSAKGVKDAVAGTMSVNNNSSIVADTADMVKAVSKDKSWAFDGAYMLVKTNQTQNAGADVYKESDYKMVGPNGVVYSFADVGTTTDADGKKLNELADSTIIAAGTYTVTAGTTEVTITTGAGADLKENTVTTLKEGSVLSKGSDFTMAAAKLLLNVDGKTTTIEKDSNSVVTINDTVVANGKTYVLDDGTILKNTSGKISVEEGQVTLASTLTSSSPASAWTIKQDSTLASGSVLASAAFGAGTVIMNKDATAAGRNHVAGSITLTSSNIQFGATATNAQKAKFDELKVTESFTFVFNKYQAASSNLADSIMSQIGSNSGQTTFISMGDMRAKALNVDDIDISTKWGAATGIETVNNALQRVSHQRSLLGATQNRLEHTIKNLDVAAENLQAAESRIRDVDMAKEIMEFTKTNILQQASQAMLAQANQAPQGVLALLR